MSGMSEGWYFWCGYLKGSRKYGKNTSQLLLIRSNMISHYRYSVVWYAMHEDHTRGVLRSYQIQESPNTNPYLGTRGQRHRMGLETASTVRPQYPVFSMQFTKYRYLNSTGTKTQTPTLISTENSLPNCIITDRTTPTIKNNEYENNSSIFWCKVKC